MRKKRMEVKICLNFEAIPPNHLLIILHEDECFFLYPSKGDVQARQWDEIISEYAFLFSYTSGRQMFFLYICLKENEVKARHHGLKSYLKEYSYFPTLQEDECFYLCSSKGDVQARFNGMKSFLKEYFYFSYSSYSWIFLLTLLSISGTCVMMTQNNNCQYS